MPPRRRSELYRLSVGVGAFALFIADLGKIGTGRPPDWWLVAALALVGVLALQFPLHVSLSEKVSVASAVFFAAVLLLPAWQAAALVAGTQAVDSLLAAVRRSLARRERPPVAVVGLGVLFNSGQAYLSALVPGLVLASRGVTASGAFTPGGAAVVTVAAVVMFAINILLVSTAVGLATSRSPFRIFLNTQRIVTGQFASLYVVGAAAAFAAVRLPWLPVMAFVPGILAYLSLRSRIELRRESVRGMERMAGEVDRRDPYTFQHSQRVAIYSHAIARTLGFSRAEIELVELAAKVHDVGKIRIPDSILLKPDRLTAEERRVMETHPRLGFEILSQFSEYAKVLELVLSHHERYDGRGYPNGTIGRRSLLIAQVIPVADSLDAMTTARAYRGAKSWDSAMEELRRGAGTQWNPQVVAAALAALNPREAEAAARPVRAAIA